MNRLVIGCGTGRCGTVSFANLLGKQYGFAAMHETYALPWETNYTAMYRTILRLIRDIEECTKHSKVMCNVGWYWINYASEVITNFKGSRIICLHRPKEEVIESFMSYRNFWVSDEQSVAWPNYDLPPREALAKYCDHYEAAARWFSERFPDAFMTIDFREALNTEEGQRQVLDFIGIPRGFQVLCVGKKFNNRQDWERPIGVLSNELEDVFTRVGDGSVMLRGGPDV